MISTSSKLPRQTALRHELSSLPFNLRAHDVLCRPENGTNCSQQIFVDITIVNTNIKVKTHIIDRRGLWLTGDGLINPVESTSEDNKDDKQKYALNLICTIINPDLLKLQKQKDDQYPSLPSKLKFVLRLKQLKSSTFDDQS